MTGTPTSEPLHLAVLAPVYPTVSETFVRREIAGLRRRGHHVVTVSLRDPDPEVVDALDERPDLVVYGGSGRLLGAAAGAMGSKRARSAVAMGFADVLAPGEPTAWSDRVKALPQSVAGVHLASELTARGVTHLHAHFAHSAASVAMYAARAAGIPFSFVGHAVDIFQRRYLLRRKLERAAFVSCISEWHREFYREVVPLDSQRLPVIRCGVDAQEFSAPETDRDENHLLAAGRLVPKKGFDLLLDAVAGIEDPPRVTIVGDGPERAALEAQVARLGLSERVAMLGARPVEEIRDLMRRATAFVLPCRVTEQGDRDGIPVVLMEAMACGLPVVSGDLPAIRELIHDGSSGVLVQSDDPASLRSAVLGVLGHRSDIDAAALAVAGRRRVVCEFEQMVNVERLERAVRGLEPPQGTA